MPKIQASIAAVLYRLNIDGLAALLSKRGHKLVTFYKTSDIKKGLAETCLTL